jgi:hypothetical protein
MVTDTDMIFDFFRLLGLVSVSAADEAHEGCILWIREASLVSIHVGIS